ncbi:MAG: hypothetical protein ACRDY6_12180 [Acidimicrobiia bacterium]
MAENPPTVRVARTARRLGAAARAADLTVPAFRCPPRVAGVRRTIRRYLGGAVVSVQLRGRPFVEVAADMVEGVIVVNGLQGEAATRMRATLADVVDDALPVDDARAA